MNIADEGASGRSGSGAHYVRRSLVGQSVLVAVVCLVVDTVSFALRAAEPHVPTLPQLLILLLIVAVDAALALPARYSGWVALAHAVFSIVFVLAPGHLPGRVDELTGGLIAGYRAGAWLRGWTAPASLVALAAGIVVSLRLAGRPDWLLISLAVGSNAVLPWLVGRYTTARRAYIDELRHRREVELRNAAAEVANAVARERTAIARDLHDVVSHHVSAIGVHAGAARMKLGAAGAGDGVAESLAAVETASRSAMADLRTMLDVLHGTSDTNQPGLDNLEELLACVRRSGLVTRLRVLGTPRPVPGSLDIALYRITQEMLTNALRHGDGSGVDVELRYRDTALTVAARNGILPVGVPAGRDGPGVPDGGGRGLAGIRTRAAMFHGNVSHGPDPDNRHWETIVTVPHPAEDPVGEFS